jgi:hypothetical protein
MVFDQSSKLEQRETNRTWLESNVGKFLGSHSGRDNLSIVSEGITPLADHFVLE